MLRRGSIVALVALVSGCAGLGTPPTAPDARVKLEEMARAQARVELRVDEVTRTLLALRERVEAQDAAIKALKEASREEKDAGRDEPEPPLPVVRVEPLPAPRQAEPQAAAPRTPPPAPDVSPPSRPSPGQDQAAASDLYRRAFNGFREGRYGQAILDFEEFLRRYPDHDYADNAQYWIGECYYSQTEYEQAIGEFGRVLDRYAGASKVPDALLKIGLCYQNLGDQEKARAFWKRLVSEHPDSEAASQARKLLGT